MCCIGKLFGSKIIYIESFAKLNKASVTGKMIYPFADQFYVQRRETFANIHTKTVTGRLIYAFADLFIVQWESMLKLYPRATYGGWIY